MLLFNIIYIVKYSIIFFLFRYLPRKFSLIIDLRENILIVKKIKMFSLPFSYFQLKLKIFILDKRDLDS